VGTGVEMAGEGVGDEHAEKREMQIKIHRLDFRPVIEKGLVFMG
jgi:hypothetical protein